MHIGLIALSGFRIMNRDLLTLGATLPAFVRRGEVIASLPSLGLLTVAGLTPPGHEVTYLEVDDLAELTDLPIFDLVGLSALTARIDDAYALAARYRALGIPVVLGGLHATACPEEALEYVDIVVTHGAEQVWPHVVEDVARGDWRPLYHGAQRGVFTTYYAQPRFDLLQRPVARMTIQTSRGCPRACDFCGASRLLTARFAQKPVDYVLEEITAMQQAFPRAFIEWADDNTFLDPRWSTAFLTAITPLGLSWFAETDVSITDHPDVCDLLASAGCRFLLIGFESPDAQALHGIDPRNWKARQAPKMQRVIDKLQDRGIGVIATFILGLDTHTPDTFPQILDWVRASGVMQASYTVLTPFPGTPLAACLRREGRLLAQRYWEQCTLFDVTYRPARMTVEELEAGTAWLMAETFGTAATGARYRQMAYRRQAQRHDRLVRIQRVES